MNIQFTARHFTPSEEIRQHATSHLERLTKFEDVKHAEVILTEEQKTTRTVRSAELIVKVNGNVLTTTASGAQFLEVIDSATAKLESQLKKYKEKHSIERRRRTKLAAPKLVVD